MLSSYSRLLSENSLAHETNVFPSHYSDLMVKVGMSICQNRPLVVVVAMSEFGSVLGLEIWLLKVG